MHLTLKKANAAYLKLVKNNVLVKQQILFEALNADEIYFRNGNRIQHINNHCRTTIQQNLFFQFAVANTL